ncbi:squalene--hopene cyclase [Bacillus coreaensis]
MRNEKVKKTKDQLIESLRGKQRRDGSWKFCFEGSLMTNAYMIILLRSLNIQSEEMLIKRLVHEICKKQENNGAWKLYYDERFGNLSNTIECYFALLYSGYLPRDSDVLQRAKSFIINNGGIQKSEWLTKSMLAITGQIPWPTIIKLIPIEIMLLPTWSPISLFEIVGYARAHWVPIIICSNKNYKNVHPQRPSLEDLNLGRGDDQSQVDDRSMKLISKIKSEAIKLAEIPEQIHEESFHKGETYMLERIESNGTLYSYFSATFFMIYSLLALGYKKDHHIIKNAIEGMKSFLFEEKDLYYIENSPSTVWDTALISNALHIAGVKDSDPMIARSTQYLLNHQHTTFGDWMINCPDTPPGGWGFSPINTMIPDIDDTTAALRALTPSTIAKQIPSTAWEKGVNWVISMQNNDGGWAAFEKNTTNKWLSFIPFRYEDRVLFDPSTADLTGRTLHFLGEYTNIERKSATINKGINWLKKHQLEDGSWYGRWGICYIYGTWAAVTGLLACGVSRSDPTIKRAVNWLVSIQNNNGGWGESCSSDMKKKYTPLYASTPSQTAWALDALIYYYEKPTKEIENGMEFLLSSLEKSNWTIEYPTGAGLPGGFYIHYHSYNYIWPLVTISNYQRKYL